ncbi:MAG: hypothetical protein ACRCTB_12185 [Vibrio sp.]
MMLMGWVLIASAIPFLLVPYFAAWIWHGHRRGVWMPPSLVGEVDLTFSGQLQIGQQRLSFKAIDTLYAPWFIRLQGEGQAWLIWRDSCDPITYRQLLVRLKRELNCSRNDWPIA